MIKIEELEKEIQDCIAEGGDCLKRDNVFYCLYHNWQCPYQLKDVIQRVSYCMLKKEDKK